MAAFESKHELPWPRERSEPNLVPTRPRHAPAHHDERVTGEANVGERGTIGSVTDSPTPRSAGIGAMEQQRNGRSAKGQGVILSRPVCAVDTPRKCDSPGYTDATDGAKRASVVHTSLDEVTVRC